MKKTLRFSQIVRLVKSLKTRTLRHDR